jgi:drug/metabolite transporter (DMT)-like permease
VAFGSLPIFGRIAFSAGLNVQSALGLRFVAAGVLLAAYVALRRLPLPPPRTTLALVLMGFGYVSQSAAYFNSIRYIPVAVTSILLYTYPVIVALLSWPLYGARITRGRALALVLALAGCALVASPAGGLRVEGVVLGLLSAGAYSTYILVGKRVLQGVDPWVAVTIISLTAGVVFLTIAFAGGTFTAPATADAVLAVAGLAFVATIVGAGAFLAGLSRTDPAHASVLSTLEPVTTAALAALVLNEGLRLPQLLGGGLVLVGVIVISRGGDATT